MCGIGAGAMYSLPFSMYADCVTLEIFKTGKNNAGSYTGYFTFTYNLANSVALLIIGFLLDLIKFDSAMPVQAMSVQNGLGLIVFFGCSIFLSLAIMTFSRFSIKRADVLKVQMSLDRGERVAEEQFRQNSVAKSEGIKQTMLSVCKKDIDKDKPS